MPASQAGQAEPIIERHLGSCAIVPYGQPLPAGVDESHPCGLNYNATITPAWKPLSLDPARPALTLREVIDAAADYEIHHPTVPNVMPWWGITDFDNKRVFVIANADLTLRRKTMIHEFLHIARHMRGEQLDSQDEDEQAVTKLTDRIYKELYVE